MKNRRERILYLILIVEVILSGYIVVRDNYIIDTLSISKAIELLIILILIFISIMIIKILRKKFKKYKYSYGIITTLGLLLFILINMLRHSFLLASDWNLYTKYDIYNNTLYSFSSFIYLTLPFIIIIAIYSIIANIVLIKKEGKKLNNLLGIVIAIFALFGLVGTQMVYLLAFRLVTEYKALIIKQITDIFINSTLTYFYSIMLATIYCNIRAARHVPKYDKDYIIILGCMIKSDGTLTPLLKGRVDKAIEFSKMQKEKTGRDIIFIPSGGKGSNEIISEAEAMKNYLLEQGIKKDKIIIENKSTNTLENMKYSYELIDNKKSKFCFSTTNYHVFRSGVVANGIGIDCEGMGSKTKWYFHTNALIREFIADLVKDKKKHLMMLLIIYIFATMLVLLGYFNGLLRL